MPTSPPLNPWLLDAQTTPAALCDAQGTVLWSNAALHGVLGQSPKQIAGLGLDRWFAPQAAIIGMAAQVAANAGQPMKMDVQRLHPAHAAGEATDDGFQIVLTGTENAAHPVLVEWLNHAPALRVQAASHRAAQQSAQRELLRNLAHEIRNPLGGIRGAAQLLARRSTDAADREYTDVIVAETSRLQALLDRLLSAQAAPHQRSAVNVHEIFERVRSVVAAEFPNAIDWVRDYDVSLPDVDADAHQLVQIFLNLVRNAAQILVLQAVITPQIAPQITLRSRALRQVTLNGRRHKLALELLVADNGPGIPPTLRPHLFSPLVSHRPGGTGLGLHIAQSFVEQHGGMIEADPAPASAGSGAVFRVILPLA